MEERWNYFRIAELVLAIGNRCSGVKDVLALVPSLRPFIIKEKETPLISLTISDCGLTQGQPLQGDPPIVGADLVSARPFREIGDFDTGNGHTKVEKNDESGDYLFTIRNIDEEAVCLMRTNKDNTVCECQLVGRKAYWSYGLNSAIMLSYAFASASHQTLLIHASCVQQGDYAYAFIAKSGTGKSTQVSNWLKHIPGCELLNDDNPIVRIIDGKPYLFGSPWSGKTPCYRNRKAKLGAITRIERAQKNVVVKQNPIQAFTSLLPSCSTMKWEPKLYNDVMDTISKVIETTNFYTLHCLPNRESAEICSQTIRN